MALTALSRLTVKFMTGMAVDAVHSSFTEVNVAGVTFVLAQIFIAHAASVAGCA
jgi:hypothetical protein